MLTIIRKTFSSSINKNTHGEFLSKLREKRTMVLPNGKVIEFDNQTFVPPKVDKNVLDRIRNYSKSQNLIRKFSTNVKKDNHKPQIEDDLFDGVINVSSTLIIAIVGSGLVMTMYSKLF